VSTADLQIIVSGIDWLALIAAGWSLVYFQRVLLAASPKPQPPQAEVPAAPEPAPKAAAVMVPPPVLTRLADVPNVVPM
jgi:hypothetical protein